MDLLILASFLPILAAAAIFDLRSLTIPNPLVIAGLVLFAALAILLPVPTIEGRLIAAGVVALASFLAFAGGWIGGGDAKLLPVMMLYIPTPTLPLFAVVFAGALLAGIAFVAVLRTLHVRRDWAAVSTPGALPMAFPMALAGAIHALRLVGTG